jgi:hypothetical protein
VIIQHAQPKSNINTGHGIAAIDCSELSLREDLSVSFEFFERIGFLGGVNQPANLEYGLVVQGLNQTDSIVGWKHEDSYPVMRTTRPVRVFESVGTGGPATGSVGSLGSMLGGACRIVFIVNP